MILYVVQWLFYIAAPALSAYVALWVWDRHESFGYAMTSATLAGVAFMLILSAIFWEGTSICDQCHQGAY